MRFDQENPLLVRISDTTWDVSGALPLHELEELAGVPLLQEGITTVSGWVTHRLGGFPKRGDVVPIGGYELSVEEIDGMRVARLRLSKASLSAGKSFRVIGKAQGVSPGKSALNPVFGFWT